MSLREESPSPDDPRPSPRVSASSSRAPGKSSIAALRPPSPASAVHLDVVVFALVGPLDPEHVVTPDQDLAEVARELGVDELLGVAELDVHVAVDADQSALVLGLAPV